MSVRKPRSQGKGDGRRDNLRAFISNFPSKAENRTSSGKLFLKKHNRTVIKYA